MEENIERLIEVLKKQAELFLLDASEFYPYGTYINLLNEIVPVGVYLDEDHPDVCLIINLLEKSFEKVDYIIAAIAIDVNIKENDKVCDAIELRFFEPQKNVFKKHIKYSIEDNHVLFIDI